MADYEVDLRDTLAATARWRGAERVVREEMVRGMTRSVIAVEAQAKRNVEPFSDTRDLKRSLTHEVQSKSMLVEGRVGTNKPHGIVVEQGRGSGKPMPPPGVLIGWMARHGIPVSAEFVIRRAIGRRGIKARPYLNPALNQMRPAISREFAAVVKRVSTRLAGR